MKIKNKKSRFNSSPKKKVIILTSLVLAVALTAVAYFVYDNRNGSNNSEKSGDDSAQTDSAKKDAPSDDSKTTVESTDPSVKSGSNADQAPQPQGAAVTMASYAQKNHQVATVVNVTGESSASTCTFTFSHQDAKPVVRQVKTSNKTCATSISEGEFNIIGLWQLNVSLYNGSSKLAETNQNVTIN